MPSISNGLVSLIQKAAHVLYESMYPTMPDQELLDVAADWKSGLNDTPNVTAQNGSSFNFNSTGFIAGLTVTGGAVALVLTGVLVGYFVYHLTKTSEDGSEGVRYTGENNKLVKRGDSMSDDLSLSGCTTSYSENSILSEEGFITFSPYKGQPHPNSNITQTVSLGYQQEVQDQNTVEFL